MLSAYIGRILALEFLAAMALATPPAVLAQTQSDTTNKWDVTAAIGPRKTVAFTVTEGTWMNVDVAPDGREIAFDLVGDIYLLPIAGGTARRITSGPAFDVQPRFSPDGSKIGFTSDRAGGDNIWVMNRDGSDTTQITKEKFRLLNNAVWSPDGEYLIARKHFTSRRSLGAGEMWMYHRSGGSGIQLTKRKNNQQDAGEPEVSPDGRYLWWSEDMSGDTIFQYNKDPNRQIYVIRQLDRETGKITRLITGAGGSVRPRVSPDGQTIAFVRRVRTETVLYLYDRETGAHDLRTVSELRVDARRRRHRDLGQGETLAHRHSHRQRKRDSFRGRGASGSARSRALSRDGGTRALRSQDDQERHYLTGWGVARVRGCGATVEETLAKRPAGALDK
jgi:Tol biopolymer transport system component